MTVVGIDYSLNSPGICVMQSPSDFYFVFYVNRPLKNDNPIFRPIIRKKFNNIIEKMTFNAHVVTETIPQNALVCIEDYAISGKGRITYLAENGGILKYVLYKKGIEYSLVGTGTVKKFATGKGNATKDQMVEAFINQTDIDLFQYFNKKKTGGVYEDIADSYFIARYMWDQIKKSSNDD